MVNLVINNDIKKLKHIFSIMSLLLFLTGCSYFPRVYMADEVHGSVVDAETGEPIDDVMVLIYWEQWGGFLSEGHVTQYLVLKETVTDVNGHYSFPSWGPKITISGFINDSNPFFMFHKRGYSPVYTYNIMPKANRPYVMESDLTDKAIKLKPFKGSLEEYAREVSMLDSPLNSHRSISNCDWEDVPEYAAELINLNNYFIRNQVRASLPDMNSYTRTNCNDPKEVLKEYLNE